jgi:hypothetical protein
MNANGLGDDTGDSVELVRSVGNNGIGNGNSRGNHNSELDDIEIVVTNPLNEKGKGVDRVSDFNVADVYSHNNDVVDDDVKIPDKSLVPNIWTKNFIGLYCSYAIFGLLLGGSGTWLPFCEYVYKGSSNLCANTGNIGFFAWNLKVFVAVVTDMYQPFGYRRKSWMIMGLAFALGLTFILAVVPPDDMGANVWISIQFFIQVGVMFSDVPADGYSVELGQLESLEERGQILVMGQKIQYVFCMVAGLIQTFMLNGQSTSASDCPIEFSHCWSWGLTVQQYNGLMFAIIFVLSIPVLFLKEIDNENIPHRSGEQFLADLWNTMQNLTTMYLTIYVLGISMFTYTYSNVNLYIQYYILQLTNFQVGIDTIATYLGLWGATYLFQVYLIKKNWRYTQYFATYFQVALSLLWIGVYYNSSGMRNPWLTIFIDLDTVCLNIIFQICIDDESIIRQNFSLGLTEILFAVAVIEVAKPGQEASTYEFLSTVLNNGWSFALILSSQMLIPLKAGGCTDDQDNCNDSQDEVNISSVGKYTASNGPWKFTQYTLVLCAINIIGVLAFTHFLPSGVEECHKWKQRGIEAGDSKSRGYASLWILIVSFVVSLWLIVAVLLSN